MWKLVHVHSNKWIKFTPWDPVKRLQSTASVSVKLGNRYRKEEILAIVNIVLTLQLKGKKKKLFQNYVLP
jgi:hypothetical protein